MKTFAKLAVLALLTLAISLSAYSNAAASRPYCNVQTQSEVIFRGNFFSVSWIGSPSLSRAFVAWPLDQRDHWAVYELILTEESFGKTVEHAGSVPVDLAVGNWKGGQLITILDENSPQEGHQPPQFPPMEHGRLLQVLNLIPQQEETPPEGAPLCKAYLAPLRVKAVP
ncbi:MAG TPA: hypothetical protein VIH42_09690 [Thermoguttaceae bacterium]